MYNSIIEFIEKDTTKIEKKYKVKRYLEVLLRKMQNF